MAKKSVKELSLKLPFVHSVLLIGSRARGDGNAGSDYDLYVVVPISALPLVFPVLKKKEKGAKHHKAGELKGIRKNIFGISTGGDLIYSFKNHMIIGLKMDVNFNLNSVNSSKEFGYYPWSFFIGPQFGLKF